jgi:hypothetical protein
VHAEQRVGESNQQGMTWLCGADCFACQHYWVDHWQGEEHAEDPNALKGKLPFVPVQQTALHQQVETKHGSQDHDGKEQPARVTRQRRIMDAVSRNICGMSQSTGVAGSGSCYHHGVVRYRPIE